MSTKSIQLDTSKVSTLHLGAIINEAYCPQNVVELMEIYEVIGNNSPLIVGGLSNTLIVEEIDKPVIFINNIKNLNISNNKIYVSGGENLVRVCKVALENNLSNIEPLCGIPGTIGGALKNNSGCYGSTISDYLERVEVFAWDTGKIVELSKNVLTFGYRHSCFRTDKDIIIGATFTMKPSKKSIISKRMKEVSEKRRNSQPNSCSLGSVFKRCNDISAGYYIEKAGLKGYNHNGMEVSSVHANFIVNKGGEIKDYLYLVNLAKTKVYELFGVKLEEEVRIIGIQQSIGDSK
jgi:UDP-N-acetylmuramate dehydrogenase